VPISGIECRANQKTAKPWFDSRCDSASLCPWERPLMLFSSWGQAVYPLWWPSLTKGMQTQQLLRWCGMINTEHTIFGSNKEVPLYRLKNLRPYSKSKLKLNLKKVELE